MKDQPKTNQPTPQTSTPPNTSPKKPAPEQRNENQQSAPQNVADKNKKEQKLNPGVGKEHQIGDLPEKNDSKNQGNDMDKQKDPDPTKPEKRNDPVAGQNDDYSRTRNTPGKTESNTKGEFTGTDEMDRDETTNTSDEEQDEEKPGSFDPEADQKEAFGGERKNSNAPDDHKNKNGL